MEAELITLFVVVFGIIVAGCAIGWILIDFIFPHIIIPLIAIHPLLGFLIFILIITALYVPIEYVFSVLIEFVEKIGDERAKQWESEEYSVEMRKYLIV